MCLYGVKGIVINMPGVYICEIIGREELNDVTHAVTFISAGLASISRPGQFLHIKCGEGLILRRPIGICSVSGNAVTIVFERKGKGTDWLSRCKTGDALDILGPLGNGFRFPEGKIIVVGGGLGSPPMIFAAGAAKGGTTAILGFRDKSRAILISKFIDICDEVYLTTDDGSSGLCGTVAVPLEALLKKGGYDAVLACGQHTMQRAVAQLCQQYGVPCQVSLEERMGCGVGACLVCACATRKNGNTNMSRVCKDGPVFDSTDVIW
jgi:dihydroorotate dehydrogenase electron transfer subunit